LINSSTKREAILVRAKAMTCIHLEIEIIRRMRLVSVLSWTSAELPSFIYMTSVWSEHLIDDLGQEDMQQDKSKHWESYNEQHFGRSYSVWSSKKKIHEKARNQV
jgi:hypothetical protein